MLRILLTACLCLAGSLVVQPSVSAQGDGNASTQSMPCIATNRFESMPVVRRTPGEPIYDASAEIENLCGRSVEVTYCFLYAKATDGADKYCVDTILRPWGIGRVARDSAPARVIGFEPSWRYLATP